MGKYEGISQVNECHIMRRDNAEVVRVIMKMNV